MNTIKKDMKIISSADEVQFSESMIQEIPMNSLHFEDSSNKHEASPLKTKSKTFRSENQEDVHSLSPMPVTSQSQLSKNQADSPCGSSFASAYYLGDGTEELPEIIWDYSSPKYTKDAKKNESPVTIKDLLKNLEYGTKGKPNTTEMSSDIKLLDKWMDVKVQPSIQENLQKTPVRKKGGKKSRRELMAEMEMVLDSLKASAASSNSNSSSVNITHEADKDKIKSLQVKSYCANEDGNLDSSDEMWGSKTDGDVLIMEATEEFQSCLISSHEDLNAKSVDQQCTFTSMVLESSEKNVEVDSFLRNVDSNRLVSKKENLKKPQLLNCTKENSDVTTFEKHGSIVNENSPGSTWDSEFDSAWDDDILAAETIRQIPDDVLLGKVDSPAEVLETCVNKDFPSLNSETKLLTHKTDRVGNKMHEHDGMVSSSVDFSKTNMHTATSNKELLQESDSDLFSDDLGLNEQEIVTLLDRMESQCSSKCTPEEIAQKKEDALKRLRHSQK